MVVVAVNDSKMKVIVLDKKCWMIPETGWGSGQATGNAGYHISVVNGCGSTMDVVFGNGCGGSGMSKKFGSGLCRGEGTGNGNGY
jgi:hypothetical protein